MTAAEIQKNAHRIRLLRSVQHVTALPLMFATYAAMGSPMAFGILYWSIILGILAFDLTLGFVARKAAKRLAELDDISIIGPVIEACQVGSYWNASCRDLKVPLARLLSRIDENTTDSINSSQGYALFNMLVFDEGWPFYGRLVGLDVKLQVLRIFGNTATESELPFVKAIARKSRDSTIRTKATQCLATLSEQAERQMAEAKLLRPVEHDAGSDLLRVAAGSTESEDQNLLRPTNVSPR
jgi:hypothetical protein